MTPAPSLLQRRLLWCVATVVVVTTGTGCATTQQLLRERDLHGACRVAHGETMFSEYDLDAVDAVRAEVSRAVDVDLRPLHDDEVVTLLGEPFAAHRQSALLAELSWGPTVPGVALDVRDNDDSPWRMAPDAVQALLPQLLEPAPPTAPLGPTVDPEPPAPPPKPKPRRGGGRRSGFGGLLTSLLELPGKAIGAVAEGIAAGIKAGVEVGIVLPIRVARELLSGRAVLPPGHTSSSSSSSSMPEKDPHQPPESTWFHDAVLPKDEWLAVVDARERQHKEAMAAHTARLQRRQQHLDAWRATTTPTCDGDRCRAVVLLSKDADRAQFIADAVLGADRADDACPVSDVRLASAAVSLTSSRPSEPAADAAATLDLPPIYREVAVDHAPLVGQDPYVQPDLSPKRMRRWFQSLDGPLPLPLRQRRLMCDITLDRAYRYLQWGKPDLGVRLSWGRLTSRGATLRGFEGQRRITVVSPPIDLDEGDFIKLTLGVRAGSDHNYLGAQVQSVAAEQPLQFTTKSFKAACRVVNDDDLRKRAARALATMKQRAADLVDGARTAPLKLPSFGFPKQREEALSSAVEQAAGFVTWADPEVQSAFARRHEAKELWAQRAQQARKVAFVDVKAMQSPVVASDALTIESVHHICSASEAARDGAKFHVRDRTAFRKRCLLLVVSRAHKKYTRVSADRIAPAVGRFFDDDGHEAQWAPALVAKEGGRWFVSASADAGQRLLQLFIAPDDSKAAPVVALYGKTSTPFVRPTPLAPMSLKPAQLLAHVDGKVEHQNVPHAFDGVDVVDARAVCDATDDEKKALETFFTSGEFARRTCFTAVLVRPREGQLFRRNKRFARLRLHGIARLEDDEGVLLMQTSAPKDGEETFENASVGADQRVWWLVPGRAHQLSQSGTDGAAFSNVYVEVTEAPPGWFSMATLRQQLAPEPGEIAPR